MRRACLVHVYALVEASKEGLSRRVDRACAHYGNADGRCDHEPGCDCVRVEGESRAAPLVTWGPVLHGAVSNTSSTLRQSRLIH